MLLIREKKKKPATDEVEETPPVSIWSPIFCFSVVALIAWALWEGRDWGIRPRLFPWAIGFPGLAMALFGGVLAKGRDLGVDNDFMKEVSNSLEPGGSAVFMLVYKATPDKATEELSKYGGHLAQTSLSKEDEEHLRQALEHDTVKTGIVEDTLDLEEA